MSRLASLKEKLDIIPLNLPLTLSLSRIALTPVVWILLQANSPLILPLYLLACSTDLLDGKVAKLLNSSSINGAILDVSADFLLVTTGFTYYMLIGLISPMFLWAMTFSFLQYLLTMSTPIKDPLGKHIGTVLFALLALTMLSPTASVTFIVSLIGISYIAISLISRFQSLHAYYANEQP